MKTLWYRFWHWLCVRVYFERVTVLHRERLPLGGPVLYIGLHRNGAVDGFIYHQAAPRCVFLVSTQLLRSFFSRLFFGGIAVARSKDAESGEHNEAALRQCVELLDAGGELFVFPEGTSTLGPRHLPFKSGAVQLALSAIARGIPLRIVPLGIHYERAWAFRSRVEVVVGEPVSTELSSGLSKLGRLKEMKRRMAAALEVVGANFESANAQESAERLGCAATLGTPCSYFDSLKAFESGVPASLLAQWRMLESELGARRLLLHQGVPLFPAGSCLLYALLLLLLGPIVLAGVLVNFLPLLAGWLAAHKFADDRNVIALWRILVGLPLLVLWSAAMAVTLASLAGWSWMLAYVALTVSALKGLYRVKKLFVAVWNGIVHRHMAPRARAFHQALLLALPSA